MHINSRFVEEEQSDEGLHQMLKERDKQIVELEYKLTSAHEDKAYIAKKQRFVCFNVFQ